MSSNEVLDPFEIDAHAAADKIFGEGEGVILGTDDKANDEALKAQIQRDIKQAQKNLQNLPAEMRNAQRFFPVKADKSPIIKEWQNPDNQRYRHDVAGLKGFDVCGHGRGVDYLMIDFDHVLNDAGEFIYPDAEKWFNFLSNFGETFCERSISGHGLHMFAVPTADKFQKIASGQRGQIVFDKAVGAKIELFYKPRGRYCLVTGDLFRCEPTATIPHGEVADGMFQQLLNAIAASKPAREPEPKTCQNLSSAAPTGNELEIMRDILRVVDPNQLDGYTEWMDLGFCAKRYYLTYEEFDAFCARDKRTRANGQPMYAPRAVRALWDSAKTDDKCDDTDVGIGTAIEIAKRFGYQPPRRNPHVTGDEPTTKFKIPTCPVDLFIPCNVIFNTQGITLVESRGKGKDGEEREARYVKASATPIVPTKIFRDENSGLVQYELAILTQDKWRRHVVDGRTIQSSRCVDKLANFGALIVKTSPLCEYFTLIIAANADRLKTCRVFAQPGWIDDKFQNFIYPTGGETYTVARAGYNYSVDYSTRGNVDDWRQVFGEAMRAGGYLARVFVGVAVAAPLIRPLKITNLQVHLFGEINAGKTVLARLTASIWGNPKELLKTFESSPKRRQADAAAYNDMPTFNDELETVRGQRAEMSLTQSVYAFFNGVGNQNLNVDGTARDTFKFSGSRLSTGERQILKVADQFGAYKRLVQLECRGKIFDKQLAAEIARFVLENFGHVGKTWIEYISANLPVIRASYEAHERDVLADKTHEETQLRTICAAVVAYQFFAQCIGLQAEFDEQIFTADVSATINELASFTELSDSARALEVLRDIVASNEDRFYLETNTPGVEEYAPQGYGEHWGKMFLDGGVAIIPTMLSQILAKAGFASPDMLISAWHDEGKLTATEGHTRRIRIGGTRRYAIFFNAGVLSDSRDNNPPMKRDDRNICPP